MGAFPNSPDGVGATAVRPLEGLLPEKSGFVGALLASVVFNAPTDDVEGPNNSVCAVWTGRLSAVDLGPPNKPPLVVG